MKSDIVVIGGGPAGLIAAASAALNGNGKSVTLIEKNALIAKKLRITGKGRCNITNACDISDFIPNIRTNSSFMYSALYSFTNENIISILNKFNVKTKIERGNRIFPVSDNANDVAEALKRYALNSGVKFITEKVVKIDSSNNKICGVTLSNNSKIECEKVILASGGVSYPKTGSTGDGYRFASKLGHTIVPPKPSLVPLTSNDSFIKELQGLSLKNISIKITDKNNKIKYDDFGEMMFSHFGVTGPVILSASANVKNIENNNYTLHIDLKPALDETTLDKRIQRDFAKFINKNFSNALDDLLPKKLIPVIINLSGIEPLKKVNSITHEERIKLNNLIKDFKVNLSGTRPIDEAIITSGGVSVKEINPSDMQSKMCDGLYFAGEIIDVDGYTGGFNLQIAYSTGYLAGLNSVL